MNQDWLRSGPSIADLHAIKRRSFLDIICPTHTRFNLTDELHGSLDTISLRAKRYQLCLSQTSLPTSKAVVLLLLTETKGSFLPSFLIVSKERIQRDVRGHRKTTYRHNPLFDLSIRLFCRPLRKPILQ